MSALGWLLVGVMAVAASVSLCFAWYCASELDRVQRLHAHHVLPRPGYEPGPLALFFRRLRWQRKPSATALYACCVHCQDGSPCEPRDSHKEPCWDCDGDAVPAAQIEAQEHADAMHELAGPPSPEGEHPYPPHVPAWQPVEREHAEGDPFTGSQPILTDEVYEQMRAERPPTIEQLRQEYFRWKQPVYGEAPVLAVDEAQRLAAEVIT